MSPSSSSSQPCPQSQAQAQAQAQPHLTVSPTTPLHPKPPHTPTPKLRLQIPPGPSSSANHNHLLLHQQQQHLHSTPQSPTPSPRTRKSRSLRRRFLALQASYFKAIPGAVAARRRMEERYAGVFVGSGSGGESCWGSCSGSGSVRGEGDGEGEGEEEEEEDQREREGEGWGDDSRDRSENESEGTVFEGCSEACPGSECEGGGELGVGGEGGLGLGGEGEGEWDCDSESETGTGTEFELDDNEEEEDGREKTYRCTNEDRNRSHCNESCPETPNYEHSVDDHYQHDPDHDPDYDADDELDAGIPNSYIPTATDPTSTFISISVSSSTNTLSSSSPTSTENARESNTVPEPNANEGNEILRLATRLRHRRMQILCHSLMDYLTTHPSSRMQRSEEQESRRIERICRQDMLEDEASHLTSLDSNSTRSCSPSRNATQAPVPICSQEDIKVHATPSSVSNPSHIPSAMQSQSLDTGNAGVSAVSVSQPSFLPEVETSRDDPGLGPSFPVYSHHPRERKREAGFWV